MWRGLLYGRENVYELFDAFIVLVCHVVVLFGCPVLLAGAQFLVSALVAGDKGRALVTRAPTDTQTSPKAALQAVSFWGKVKKVACFCREGV